MGLVDVLEKQDPEFSQLVEQIIQLFNWAPTMFQALFWTVLVVKVNKVAKNSSLVRHVF